MGSPAWVPSLEAGGSVRSKNSISHRCLLWLCADTLASGPDLSVRNVRSGPLPHPQERRVPGWHQHCQRIELFEARITLAHHLAELARVREEAIAHCQISAGVHAEHLRGKAAGFYRDRLRLTAGPTDAELIKAIEELVSEEMSKQSALPCVHSAENREQVTMGPTPPGTMTHVGGHYGYAGRHYVYGDHYRRYAYHDHHKRYAYYDHHRRYAYYGRYRHYGYYGWYGWPYISYSYYGGGCGWLYRRRSYRQSLLVEPLLRVHWLLLSLNGLW